uniref:EFCAB10 C-terminal EF-hand domain-containing protein n=1 Tax=Podarcis muralis TaxID=64176 RepID=A0A670J863_PODMU
RQPSERQAQEALWFNPQRTCGIEAWLPREFLIKTLEKIKYAKITSTDFPYLMDESNVDAMFEMLDVAGQGYITIPQYKGGYNIWEQCSQLSLLSHPPIINLPCF